MAALIKMLPSMCSIFVLPHFTIVFYLQKPRKANPFPIRGGFEYTRDMSILAYTLSHAQLVILQAFRACGNIRNIQIYLFIQIIQQDQGYGPSLVQVKPQQGPFILNNILRNITTATALLVRQIFIYAYMALSNQVKKGMIRLLGFDRI